MKDVVRSSILSKTWTNKWTLVTNVSIDDFLAREPDDWPSGDEVVRFVNKFWSMHNGPIDKLDIYTESWCVAREVEDQWLLTACQKDVKELTVEFNRHIFIAPPCIYSCQSLTRLELITCKLMEPPPDFSGFSFMKRLVLKDVSNFREGMESLISSCPLLESLTLVYFEQPKLTIRAPKLRCLDLEGRFERICLENTPLLSCMTVAQRLKSGFDGDYVEKLLGSVPKLRRLCGHNNFTRSLSAGTAADPCKFITYELLKRIELNLCRFDDSKEALVALRLIFSAPNLQELYIHGCSYLDEIENPCLDFFNDPILAYRMMNQLELVEISYVKDETIFMKIVEFLLEHSPALVKMIIRPSRFFRDEERTRLISSFRRASRKASIVIFDD